jgi:hypothetical protein
VKTALEDAVTLLDAWVGHAEEPELRAEPLEETKVFLAKHASAAAREEPPLELEP